MCRGCKGPVYGSDICDDCEARWDEREEAEDRRWVARQVKS